MPPGGRGQGVLAYAGRYGPENTAGRQVAVALSCSQRLPGLDPFHLSFALQPAGVGLKPKAMCWLQAKGPCTGCSQKEGMCGRL